MFLSINDFEYFRLLLMRCWGSITKKIKWENDSGISLHLNSNILLRECMLIFSNTTLKSFHPEQPVCGHNRLLARVNSARREAIAADALHDHSAVLCLHGADLGHGRFRPCRNTICIIKRRVFAVGTDVKNTGRTDQHRSRLLTCNMGVRCKSAVSDAVHNAKRRTRKNVRIIRIRKTAVRAVAIDNQLLNSLSGAFLRDRRNQLTEFLPGFVYCR